MFPTKCNVLIIVIIGVLFFSACSPALKSQKAVINSSEILYGRITKEQLYFDYPAWQEIENMYEADNATVKIIKSLKKK